MTGHGLASSAQKINHAVPIAMTEKNRPASVDSRTGN
jgi:hypothetical protein